MILLARAVTPGDFGSFTLVYSALLFGGVLQGALVTQPHNVIGAGLRGDAGTRAILAGEVYRPADRFPSVCWMPP